MLSSLELYDALHRALCVFYYGCLDIYDARGKEGFTTQGVVSRAHFVYLGQGETVANTNILQTRDCEDVARGEDISLARDGGYNIALRLGTNVLEDGGGRESRRNCGCWHCQNMISEMSSTG